MSREWSAPAITFLPPATRLQTCHTRLSYPPSFSVRTATQTAQFAYDQRLVISVFNSLGTNLGKSIEPFVLDLFNAVLQRGLEMLPPDEQISMKAHHSKDLLINATAKQLVGERENADNALCDGRLLLEPPDTSDPVQMLEGASHRLGISIKFPSMAEIGNGQGTNKQITTLETQYVPTLSRTALPLPWPALSPECQHDLLRLRRRRPHPPSLRACQLQLGPVRSES